MGSGPGPGYRPGGLVLVVVLAVILAATTLVAGPGAGAQSAPADGREGELRGESEGPVRIVDHVETGQVRFVGTTPGTPLEVDTAEFADRFGPLFGSDGASTLEEVRTEDRVGGGSATLFQQEVDGVPVVAGEILVQADNEGRVLSASGEVSTVESADGSPDRSADQGVTEALASVAREYAVPEGALEASQPELWVFDPALLDGPEAGPARQVWRLEVRGSSPGGEPLRILVLVDATTGAIALQFNEVAHLLDRTVCDDANVPSPGPSPHDAACGEPFDRTEGQAATGNAEVDDAYDHMGDYYDFFFDRFGRDSLDDAGHPLVATVRWCPPAPGDCPLANAFWDETEAAFGDGEATDDTVGHELTHGFVQYTSDLFLYHQSGAINESLADVFGELVDLTNGAGGDSAGVRWDQGEDSLSGAIRDLADPGRFGHPDRMASPNYLDTTVDGGGVHTNSGVNNKAASLMVDGGSFNGQTISPLGITRTARIYYEVATTLLTSGSDYADLGTALTQACNNLLGVDGITAADCTEVSQVVLATEMATDPPNAPAPEAPVCPAGQAPVDLFADGMENPGSGNWLTSTTVPAAAWSYRQGFAHSGVRTIHGPVQATGSDSSAVRSAALALPPNAFLWVAHNYEFDGAFDGGVMEYFVVGGSAWQDAGPLFTHQGYTGTISGSGNPLAGRQGFVERSRGYLSSRLDLSSLSGESIWYRFRVGLDNTIHSGGWSVDDVRIYTCSEAALCNTEPPAHGFGDIPAGAFYEDGLVWAKCHGVVSGFPGNLYKPKDPVLRGQAANMLWTVMDQPTGSPAHGFVDIPAGAFYDAALDWAKAEGLVSGFPGQRYKPKDPVNRGQIVNMLFQLASNEDAWSAFPDPPPSTVTFGSG